LFNRKPAASAVPLTSRPGNEPSAFGGLKGLGNLPEDTRGILSNCACLGEGVDVPVLDGVEFIDPKRSMVEIIQAVGRVIRKAEGKSAEGGAPS
jgi:helicase-like protein